MISNRHLVLGLRNGPLFPDGLITQVVIIVPENPFTASHSVGTNTIAGHI